MRRTWASPPNDRDCVCQKDFNNKLAHQIGYLKSCQSHVCLLPSSCTTPARQLLAQEPLLTDHLPCSISIHALRHRGFLLVIRHVATQTGLAISSQRRDLPKTDPAVLAAAFDALIAILV